VSCNHGAFQSLVEEDMSQSLLEKAGLERPPRREAPGRRKIEVIEAEFEEPDDN